MRKVVIDTGALYRLNDDRKVLDAIKEGGFKYFDLTLFWKGTTEHIGTGPDCLENAKKLKEYADSLGLECEQSHAYFTSGIDEAAMARRYDYIPKDMRIASIMGAKSIVLHPVSEFTYEENIEFVKRFIPLAHELDIKICVENIWHFSGGKVFPICTTSPESFVKFLDEINDPYVVACLDIGHAEMDDNIVSAVKMIRALGSRLYALHIHDNNKKNDSHQLPFTQQINFYEILEALKEIKYPGNITFEVETCYNRGENPRMSLPFELIPAFVRIEREIGQFFSDYLDKK